MRIADIDAKRKQRFAYLCIAFSLPVVVCFTVIDFIEGDTLEIIINILTAIVLLFGLHALRGREINLMDLSVSLN